MLLSTHSWIQSRRDPWFDERFAADALVWRLLVTIPIVLKYMKHYEIITPVKNALAKLK